MQILFTRAIILFSVLFLCISPLAAQDESFIRGDVNQDSSIDISDPVAILLYMFSTSDELSCEKAADANDSGSIDISDSIYLLQFLFANGPAPESPFGACGQDPTPDDLTCVNPSCNVEEFNVIISEFMASNANSLLDEDGDTSDWIELHMLDNASEPTADLTGWYLTDNPTNLTKWQFPSVSIEKGGYLVVFASGKDRAVAGSELHTNFQLNSDGEYLALVASDGITIVDEFYPVYPEQLTDISYGQAQWTETLINTGADILYHVPTASDSGVGSQWTETGYNTSSWTPGLSGIGFSGIATEGFEVTYIKANIAVTSLSIAEEVLENPDRQSSVSSETAPFIDYFNTGGSGNFSNDNPFPGIESGDIDDFIVHATGTILIPETGEWSFGVNSDDGFGFELSNGSDTFTMSYPDPRGSYDTIETFNITQAGPYDISLLYYEHGGGAEVELFAGKGTHPTFNANDFQLVGDTTHGGLGLLGFAGDIKTDVGGEMQNNNASIWTRINFNVSDKDSIGGIFLRMKYEDGFVAFINGNKVAERNSPASVQWNSSATSDRPIEDVSVEEEINLSSYMDLLENGPNVLAIQGLNDSASNSEFLIQPKLIVTGNNQQLQYMSTPTPGSFNVSGQVNFVRKVEFSVEHGFYDVSFPLALTTITPDAEIRYTLDGSTPTLSNGIIYTGPIQINGTTVIRAGGFKPGFLDSRVHTRSYIFVTDVITQSPNGEKPGPNWPSGSVNGQTIDYGMDPDIVSNSQWSDQVEDALLSIPSISLVTDLDNLFSSSKGIYVNAGHDGRAWERKTSAELLNPDGTEGFSINAGLRIRGAFSRSGGNPKHSLRLFFRSEYGKSKLKYPLFGGEGVDQFDKVDLRTSQNYSWAFQGSTQNTFLRDVFSRDTQRDMGQPYTRSRYYHLYINGQYWGLYQTQERADADYAESYLGGDKDDYDAVKNNSSGGRELQATDGTMDAYRRLYDAAVAGFSSNTAYMAIQGLKPDGTIDPNGERLVNPENLMDYMICTYYTGDPDSPVSCWAHFSNNIFTIYNHTNPEGFVWFRHDAEHSLGANGGLYEARILTDPTDRSIGQEWRHFNPAWLHLQLTANTEYLMEFSDRVNKYFFSGGLLSATPNIKRWMDRANQIDLAIIGASARWGDAKTNPPRTKNDWLGQTDYMVNTFFPQRTQIVLDQMRSVNMFPDQALVSFNKNGGEVDPGFKLSMSQGNGTPGTIYYTLDGSDPRQWGGSINPSAEVFTSDTSSVTLISSGSTWKYKDDGSDQGTVWRDLNFTDTGWDEGPAELGYGDGGEATVVGFGPDPNNKYPTTYFRHKFTVEDASKITELTLGLVRDDGAVVYLNGVEATPRINMPSGDIDYQTLAEGNGVPVGGADESTFHTYSVDPGLLVEGTNIMAVEIHQANVTSSDISFDLRLSGLVEGTASSSIIINYTTTAKARVYDAGSWGAMTEARFTVGLKGLVINEIMASNHTTLEDPDEPGEYPDWIELYNSTSKMIDLSGLYLTDSMQDLTKWQIAQGMSLAPGQYIIFYADDDGTQGVFHTNYQLSQSGEQVALVDTDGVTIIDSIQFNWQYDDISYGRYPDGGDTWGFNQSATPGSANSQLAP